MYFACLLLLCLWWGTGAQSHALCISYAGFSVTPDFSAPGMTRAARAPLFNPTTAGLFFCGSDIKLQRVNDAFSLSHTAALVISSISVHRPSAFPVGGHGRREHVALLLEENKLLLDQQLSAGVQTDAAHAAAQRGVGEVNPPPHLPCHFLSFPS